MKINLFKNNILFFKQYSSSGSRTDKEGCSLIHVTPILFEYLSKPSNEYYCLQYDKALCVVCLNVMRCIEI